VPGRDELLENGGELLRDLLEGSLDSLVLGLVEMLNQRLDRLLRRVEFLSPLEQRVSLRREAVVLVKRLLVDVLVLLQRLVDLSEPGLNLRGEFPSVSADGSTPYGRHMLAHLF